MKIKQNEPAHIGPIHFPRWCVQVGITAATGWVWRQKRWIETINICGRPYVTPEAIAEFTRRAEAGEFAQVKKTPMRKAQHV
jgi:hypothetical protein